jgi:hypothetical protein
VGGENGLLQSSLFNGYGINAEGSFRMGIGIGEMRDHPDYVTDIIFLKNRLCFWSGAPTPMPERAPFSSVVMIFGGDEGVIQRARATWGGAFVPKRKLD